ncbi:Uma2 family endonuclease [Kribbella catacumbae]|uniref:Uma2 family endonuclease n=1 Tax=Kribbella catacumbae TaxID=460086 RepID=UPI00037C82D6|nr:Uma2 family endonuclease [Kribbella catacumbae]
MELMQHIEHGNFTLADLDALPDDGRQYELVDGIYLVTPSPTVLHQMAAMEIVYRLRHKCPPEYQVYFAPMDYRPTSGRSLQPDVIVASCHDRGPDALRLPLLLAVEVLSPATRSKDLILKRNLYEEAGVRSYWIFDPEAEALTVLELEGGRYVERAVVKGDDAFDAELPFQVRIVPSELVRRR